jgi:hypothetical protein
VEARGQDMEQEAADELLGNERHGLVSKPFLRPVVLPLKGDALFVQRNQSAVGDGDPMGIAWQICQYGLGPGEEDLNGGAGLRAAALLPQLLVSMVISTLCVLRGSLHLPWM